IRAGFAIRRRPWSEDKVLSQARTGRLNGQSIGFTRLEGTGRRREGKQKTPPLLRAARHRRVAASAEADRLKP
ncbi:MAG TPA: hypothetical protein VMS17_12790, partial [Gemmataceae bacterium]|nr:hypothetical protein [Gemmataceae bacterium]